METLKKFLNVLVLLIAIAGMVFLFISLTNDDDYRITQNERIIDSLRDEIAKKEKRRDSLVGVIDTLDSKIEIQKRIIDSLSSKKPSPLPLPLPPPKPSEARDVLDKFRKG